MKILIVVDSLNWAIGHLAKAKIKYNPHYNFKLVEVHPRDALVESVLNNFNKTVEEFNPDIIHFEYFRTASQLLQAIPELQKRKIMLTHHNQRDKALKEADWNKLGVDCLVVHTQKNKLNLEELFYNNVTVINHGIDLDYFTYPDKEPKDFFIGYAGRIVPWKRLKDISAVAKELGVKVMFMGKQDKVDYWNTFTKEEQENIRFDFMNCSDLDRINFYKNISCYVGFSDDNYEEGTLEFLEAMASGAPVITTRAGVARDIGSDHENCLMVDFGNVEQLKKAIIEVKEDKELRNKLRKNGWNAIKTMTEEKMAYEYSLQYNRLMYPNKKLVSVILPTTYNRMNELLKILKRLEEQNYKNLEVVIGFDDLAKDFNFEMVTKDLRSNFSFPIKTIITNREGYNLAMSRNMCAVETEGEYLIFIDSRILPSKTAIKEFADSIEQSAGKNIWFFGNKGADKNSFVENFSAVSRKHFINFGMMNERIDKYGGMSQEIRNRWIAQGGSFNYLPNVNAETMLSSKMSLERRKDIIDMKLKLIKMHNKLT